MGDTYTQSSSNFADSGAGGVDPRTGIYSVSLLLANIKANGSSGPNFPIALQYDPMSDIDMGFGIGWGMSCTTIGRQNGRLVLSTGEKYAIGAGCELEDQKIVTAQVETIFDGYTMRHRNGDVWVLDTLVGDNIYVPSRILAPNGLSVQLEWLKSGHLTAIKDEIRGEDDEPQALLTIDRDVTDPGELDIGETETKITLWPGTDVTKEVKLILKGQRLYRIIIEDLRWQFFYNPKLDPSKKFYPLVEVLYPTGAHDIVEYTDIDKGHKYPAAAKTSQTVPYVKKYTKIIPGNDTDRLVEYEYSPENYLGYGANITKWDPDKDNLYEASKEYMYSVTQVEYDGKNKIVTTNRYNKFHLLVEREVNNSDYIQRTTQKYDIKDGNFAAQDVWFQQAREINVEYTRPGEPTYVETTFNEFDEYGNKKSTRTPDGTLEEWEYYDADGEGEDCPPAPLKIPTYLKSSKITAPAVAGRATPQTRMKVTKYKSIDIGSITGNYDSPIQSAVVPITEDYSVDERQVYFVTTNYHETEDRISLGRIASQEHKIFSNKDAYTTTTKMNYSLSKGRLTTTSTSTGFDSLSKVTSATTCAYSGSPLETKSALGNKEAYLYDKVGRINSHKICVDTDYLHETTFEYGFLPLDEKDSETLIQYMTRTDSSNVSYKQKFNGEGHPIYESSFSDLEEEFNLLAQSYDSLGRMKTVSKFDDVGKSGLFTGDGARSNDNSGSTQVWSKKELFYDNWGQQHRYSINSGERGSSYYNPLSKNTIDYLGDENQFSSVRSDYNANYLPADVVTLDENDNEVAKKIIHCDGFGQVISQTDELGHTTSYKYDDFGRVVEASYAVGSDVATVVSRVYAPHSKDSLVTSISVNGTEIGRQKFDGFDRLVSRTVGGRTYKFEYSEDASTKPSRVTLPDGNTFTYERIKELSEAPARITATDGAYRAYQYHPITGLPTVITQSTPKGTKEAIVINLTYTNRGMVKTKTINNKFDNESYTVSYEYTIGGQLLSYTNPKLGPTTFKYDEFGRKKVVSDAKSTTIFQYDSDIGLLTGWEVTSKSGVTKVAITYDRLHREQNRTISDSASGKKLEISYEHNDIGMIKTKTTKTDNEPYGLVERYTYDARNRLTNVTYTGKNGPQDPDLGPINAITYQYSLNGKGESIEYKTVSSNATVKNYRYYYNNPDDLYQMTSSRLDFYNKYGTSFAITYYGYDKCGRLISVTRDDKTYHEVLDYDAFGQLSGYSKNNGSLSSTYQYDGLGTLRVETDGAGVKRRFFYSDGKVSSEIITQSGKEHCIGRTVSGHYYLSQYMDDEEPFRFGVDLNGSILTASQSSREAPSDYAYTPYGDRTGDVDQYLPGYNGEIVDHVTGYYHLGSGYRVYMPDLMRFNKPDSESPFGRGGLNWYAYCEGDPVNHVDPTGHYRDHATDDNTAQKVLSVVFAVVFVGIAVLFGRKSIMNLVTKDRSELSKKELHSGILSASSVLGEIGAGVAGIVAAFTEPKDPKTAATESAASQVGTVVATTLGALGLATDAKIEAAIQEEREQLRSDGVVKELHELKSIVLRDRGGGAAEMLPKTEPEVEAEVRHATDPLRNESGSRTSPVSDMRTAPASRSRSVSLSRTTGADHVNSGQPHALINGTALQPQKTFVRPPRTPGVGVQRDPGVVGAVQQSVSDLINYWEERPMIQRL